jgi:hypothetical protein
MPCQPLWIGKTIGPLEWTNAPNIETGSKKVKEIAFENTASASSETVENVAS